MENKIIVFYEKSYTDDTGKHIPELFSKNKLTHINVKSFWENVIDGFFKYNHEFFFTCIYGDLRIVIANEFGNEYKFNQYFMSGLDGKIIKIPSNTWFAVNNLGWGSSIILSGSTNSCKNYEFLDPKIFDWYSKR